MGRKPKVKEVCRWEHKSGVFTCCLTCEKRLLWHAPPLHEDGTEYTRGAVTRAFCDLCRPKVRAMIPFLRLRGYRCKCGFRVFSAAGLYKPVTCPHCERVTDWTVQNVIAGPKVLVVAKEHDLEPWPRRRRGCKADATIGPRLPRYFSLPEHEYQHIVDLARAMGDAPSRALSAIIARDTSALSETPAGGWESVRISPESWQYLKALAAGLEVQATAESALAALRAVASPEAIAIRAHKQQRPES